MVHMQANTFVYVKSSIKEIGFKVGCLLVSFILLKKLASIVDCLAGYCHRHVTTMSVLCMRITIPFVQKWLMNSHLIMQVSNR